MKKNVFTDLIATRSISTCIYRKSLKSGHVGKNTCL